MEKSCVFPFRQEKTSQNESMRFSGSPNWTRTSDTLINSQVLYRLSYGGILVGKLFGAAIPKTNERLEPCLTSVVSCWRIPIFPGRLQPSIVGTTELNFCVRNGNRWTLCVNLTNFLLYLSLTTACSCNRGNRLLSGCTFRDSNPGPTD